MTSNSNLLASRLWPMGATAGWLRAAVLALAGSIFVALAAQVSIPMVPVPMTLQTLAVFLVGGTYGARLGAATLGLYALEGVAGLPVYANFHSLFLPTGEIIASGGYILGFIAAAWIVGYLVEKGWGANILKLCAAMLIGAAVIYLPGLAWLTVWLSALKGMDVGTAITVAVTTGMVPFLLGDIIKAIVAALAFPAAWSMLGPKT